MRQKRSQSGRGLRVLLGNTLVLFGAPILGSSLFIPAVKLMDHGDAWPGMPAAVLAGLFVFGVVLTITGIRIAK